MYKLFIDDLRTPYDESWTVVRSWDEAIEVLTDRNCPEQISFDHDLGSDSSGAISQTGADIAHWCINAHMDGLIDLGMLRCVIVHSANPVGADNIAGLFRSFRQHYESGLNNLTYSIEVIPYNHV